MKKVHPGDLAGGFSDLELLYCAGAATADMSSETNPTLKSMFDV